MLPLMIRRQAFRPYPCPPPRQLRAFTASGRRLAGVTAEEAAQRLMDKFSGRHEVRRQVLDANQLQKLAVTLGRPRLCGVDVSRDAPPAGTPVPAGHHVVYFNPGAVEAELGSDGSDGTFNAPAPFTRRMWAGGRMAWHGAAPLRIGDEVEERTRLVGATAKRSRSGPDMVLVRVEKTMSGPRGGCVVDERAWMFRRPAAEADRASVGAAPAEERIHAPSSAVDLAGDGSGWPVRRLRWSPVGLFRFSALTFNGHKIHYGHEWCRGVEGHATLVVHGPLNLVCILDYWRDMHGGGGEPSSVAYRALAPVYAGETYCIRTRHRFVDEAGARCWDIVAGKEGVVCMAAEVRAS